MLSWASSVKGNGLSLRFDHLAQDIPLTDTYFDCADGLIDEPNLNAEKLILQQAGLSAEDMVKKFDLFNTCQESVWK